MKPSWTEVEEALFEQVFYAHDADAVRKAQDLRRANMLDSLSIVIIIEILVDMTDNEDAVTQAQPSDFRNLDAIRAFYEKL